MADIPRLCRAPKRRTPAVQRLSTGARSEIETLD